MDCTICTTMPLVLRPPRNTICEACYEGARSIITLTNKLQCIDVDDDDDAEQADDESSNCSTIISSSLISRKPQPLVKVIKWMNNMKEREDELNKKITFLSGFVSAFRQQLHTDILLKAGDNGPPVPAHRALLVSKSEIFKNTLDLDTCKTAPEDTITLHELNSHELQALLEFLYTGTLPPDKLQKHVYALFIAADKYMIQYLHDICERHMLSSLDASNVLDVLGVSDLCSNKKLKETAISFVVQNIDDVVFSAKYEVFAQKNQHLCVQITRAFLMNTKNKIEKIF